MSCVTCDPKSRIRTVWWDIRKCAGCGECQMLECRNPAPRSRYYSGVSGTRTTTSRGLSGIHRIVWATFVRWRCDRRCPPGRPRRRAPRDAAEPRPAPAKASKPASRQHLGPCRCFPCACAGRPNWTAPPSAGIATDNRRVFVPLTTGGLVAVDARQRRRRLAVRRGHDGRVPRWPTITSTWSAATPCMRSTSRPAGPPGGCP